MQENPEEASVGYGNGAPKDLQHVARQPLGVPPGELRMHPLGLAQSIG
jgi:hypothetical protein